MRDPERIERMIRKLRAAWYAAPDQRLGQLVFNAIRTGRTGEEMHGNQTWCFVPLIEDDEMEKRLEEQLEFLTRVEE